MIISNDYYYNSMCSMSRLILLQLPLGHSTVSHKNGSCRFARQIYKWMTLDLMTIFSL